MIIAIIDTTIQVALVGAGGVVLGSLIAAFFNHLNNLVSRRVEERRIIYDIASKLAVEQWKLDVTHTDAMNKEIGEKGIMSMPAGLDSIRLPIPHIANTVQRIISDIDSSTRPKTKRQCFQDWRSARKKKKAEPQR